MNECGNVFNQWIARIQQVINKRFQLSALPFPYLLISASPILSLIKSLKKRKENCFMLRFQLHQMTRVQSFMDILSEANQTKVKFNKRIKRVNFQASWRKSLDATSRLSLREQSSSVKGEVERSLKWDAVYLHIVQESSRVPTPKIIPTACAIGRGQWKETERKTKQLCLWRRWDCN